MNRNPAARKALGAVVRHFRKTDPRNLSQENLADLADTDRTYLGAIERGERNPSFENLWFLLHALEISWHEFGRALDEQPALRKRPITRGADPGRALHRR